MSKVATNRANFKYASDLKKRGYPTAVHALPDEVKGFIEEMLAKTMSPVTIANEVMKRYSEVVLSSGLKPLTKTSIMTYRDKYWKNTTQFKAGVLGGSKATEEEAEKVLLEFDAHKEMVEMARVQRDKAKLADNLEDKTKLPSGRGDASRKQFFDMAQTILEKEMELGLRQRVPVGIDASLRGSIDIDNDEDLEKLIEKGKEAIDALEKKGKYEISEPDGEKLGLKSSKR